VCRWLLVWRTCQSMAMLKSKMEQAVIDAVKEKRISKNMSQAKLARELDVSEGFIGNVENPKYRAKYNLNHINKLAILFKCSPRDFLPKDAIK
jgi:transcriptional regulator with XRE-family HTH domain